MMQLVQEFAVALGWVEGKDRVCGSRSWALGTELFLGIVEPAQVNSLDGFGVNNESHAVGTWKGTWKE